MRELMKNLFSLSILGIATAIFILREMLKLIFFPLYLIWKNYKKKKKEEILSKYRSSELAIISFSDVKGRLESEKI